METDRVRHFWEYRTVSDSKLDLLLRVLLEPICRAYIGASKPSHSWNWERSTYPKKKFNGRMVRGDSSTIFEEMSLLAESRWGWQRMVSIKPDPWVIDPDVIHRWQYAWSPIDRSFFETCNLALKPQDEVRILIGPKSILVHGVGPDKQEVPLVVSKPFLRSDPKYSHLPII